MPLSVDLQKADAWKRIAAWLLDIMLTCVLVVGVGALLSWAMDYDGKMQRFQTIYDGYMETYDLKDVDLGNPANPEEEQRIKKAEEAMLSNTELCGLENQLRNMMLLVATFSLLITLILLEFVVPLLLKNGQTIGKKLFSLGLIRIDSVQVSRLQLFVRAVLGKFTIETMVPFYALIMGLFGGMAMASIILIGGLGIAQVVCVFVTSTNSALHDQLSGTIVVDISSQQVFKSKDELIAYTKRIHAEKANRAEY